VKVGSGEGRELLAMVRFEILIGLEGIKTHKAIAAAAKSSPIGRRKLRDRPRREKIRRLDIGLTPLPAVLCINFTSD
jgi:hypothetical protein